MGKIMNAVSLFHSNIVEHFLSGVIIVSLIMCIIGIIKPFVFDKINHKLIRRVALFGTDIGSSFISTAVYYSMKEISFSNYWVGAISICLFSTLIYALYENFGIKDGVHALGRVAIRGLAKIFANIDNKELAKKEAKNLSNELKQNAKIQMQKISQKIDKEFEGL